MVVKFSAIDFIYIFVIKLITVELIGNNVMVYLYNVDIIYIFKRIHFINITIIDFKNCLAQFPFPTDNCQFTL